MQLTARANASTQRNAKLSEAIMRAQEPLVQRRAAAKADTTCNTGIVWMTDGELCKEDAHISSRRESRFMWVDMDVASLLIIVLLRSMLGCDSGDERQPAAKASNRFEPLACLLPPRLG